MEQKQRFVSFSGGESSGMMVSWLKHNDNSGEFNDHYVFMNTSKEKEETLQFVDKVDKEFKLNIVWLEAVFDGIKGIGYKVTNFNEAKRNGEIFEEMIICYGLPNRNYPHCNRELKLQPAERYAKDHLGKNYYRAIGIRADEFDRINKNHISLKYFYPLIENHICKQDVNIFWKNKPFRLELKGYEGNCNKCWKKTKRKLLTIIKEEEESGIIDNWWHEMEVKYGNYVPPHRASKRKTLENNLTFYRENLSHKDLVNLSKQPFVKYLDDSVEYSKQINIFNQDLDSSFGCEESCEVF